MHTKAQYTYGSHREDVGEGEYVKDKNTPTKAHATNNKIVNPVCSTKYSSAMYNPTHPPQIAPNTQRNAEIDAVCF